jgi:Xaa-Pro aminopeptidase
VTLVRIRVQVLSLLMVAGISLVHSTEGGIDYAARRARVLALMDTGSAMVLRAPDTALRNGDVNYPFRQESNLFYLCGINRSQVVLMLVPSGVIVENSTARILLFARESGPGEIALPTIPDGVIIPPGRFTEILNGLLPRLSSLFVNQSGPGLVQDWLNGKVIFFDRESKKAAEEKYPQLKVKNAGPLLAGLRARKSPAEVDLIRKAIAATGSGLQRAMQFCKPGVREYELQAEIEYPMVAQGASGTGFPSIIGSGPNSLILHYDLNRRTAQAGELVVMDVGAEMEGYAADITRTIPISGNFTPAQRNVYETVVRAQRAVIAAIRPGAPGKILDSSARAVIKDAGYDRFWEHSVSHHLGLDVHDAGLIDTLRAGMVITVEPGIYIPQGDTTVAAEYRGIGIRIEDDVLITPDGAELLSAAIPKEVAEIERIVKGKR